MVKDTPWLAEVLDEPPNRTNFSVEFTAQEVDSADEGFDGRTDPWDRADPSGRTLGFATANRLMSTGNRLRPQLPGWFSNLPATSDPQALHRL